MQEQKKPKRGSPAPAPAASPQALVRPDVSDVLNDLTAEKRVDEMMQRREYYGSICGCGYPRCCIGDRDGTGWFEKDKNGQKTGLRTNRVPQHCS